MPRVSGGAAPRPPSNLSLPSCPHLARPGIPCITDCVLAELEKLGPKYRIALRVARDPRFERLPCSHKGTYADDCIVDRVSTHKCYMVATCDKELRRRIRKVPVSSRRASEQEAEAVVEVMLTRSP